jgi:hypothetical protein
MTYTIWKAVLKLDDVQDIQVPEDSEMLTARDQLGDLCIWFKCDPSRPAAVRSIAIVGTGQEAPSGAKYVGTGFLHGGKLVLHVFDQPSRDR